MSLVRDHPGLITDWADDLGFSELPFSEESLLKPDDIFGLTFRLNAKLGEPTGLNGTGGGTWTELVNRVALTIPGAPSSNTPVWGATTWDGKYPSVQYVEHADCRLRASASGAFNANVVFKAPFTVMMIVDMPLISAGTDWMFGSEDDSCTVRRSSIEDITLRFGANNGAVLWDASAQGDLVQKSIVFIQKPDATTDSNAWAGNNTDTPAAGAGNPGATTDTDPASGGIALGSSWGGVNGTGTNFAEVCAWNHLLSTAQMNDLANNYAKAEWGDHFGTFAL